MYGKHPYHQTAKERDRERFNDEVADYLDRTSTRKVPQAGVTNGVRKVERAGSIVGWRA